MPSKFLNISTDNTLGGDYSSDEIVVSQKAIKDYIASVIGNGKITIKVGSSTAGSFYLNQSEDLMFTFPQVWNASLQIQKNGRAVAIFTANSSTNVVANIEVPTKTSDLTNDDGFITGIDSTDVTTALGYTPVPNTRTINGQALSSDITIETPPDQTGNAGKFLTTDGDDMSWATVPSLTATYDSTNERLVLA